MKLLPALLPAVAALAVSAPALAQPITVAEVESAQAAWGAGIVRIGEVHAADGDYETAAAEHLETLYAYDLGDVLFKPTKAADDQFRGSFDEAHSYFVGGIVAEDGGFAINPWTAVRFENEGVITDADSAVAMGNYYFTDPSGGEVKVEYTFGYVRDAEGDLRINLHHSSLPYPG
ncbi:hypothetical protein DDZ18_09685 [Marinicauda salina]|uniref:Phosphoribosyl-AMP cyclohydrolase n=1 Tax=Marinicauda salina TaxID=2135793 RepID=A0A2U2BSI5_9PROT|nr:hypothetical protein [Marinicauda salina]PWE16969.1 hypothetical protein DDZ18_09685 [Marinicauda salina]